MLLTCSANRLFAQVSLEHDDSPVGTISVQPMENEFNLKAGKSKEIKLFINNKSNRKMQFNIYLNDWNRDSLGVHVYSAPGTEPNSCARWISMDKKFVEVDSGQKVAIAVKMQIPDSASAVETMKWAMLFIESIEESTAPENHTTIHAEIVPKMRWGVHIYQTPPSITTKEIKLLSFKPVLDTANMFRITCQNTGKVQTRCKAYVELSSMSNNKKTTLPEIEVPLFPGQKRCFDFRLPANIAKGKYTLVGAVDGGADIDLEAAQLMVTIE
jgi:hypothetical protein